VDGGASVAPHVLQRGSGRLPTASPAVRIRQLWRMNDKGLASPAGMSTIPPMTDVEE